MLRSVLADVGRTRFATALKPPYRPWAHGVLNRRRNEAVARAGYRWECPICGESRVNTLDEYGDLSLGAVKSHIRNSDWGDHGDAGTYPADLDVAGLYRYVTPVEDD